MINAAQHLLFLLCKLECNAGYLLFFLLRVVLHKVPCDQQLLIFSFQVCQLS
jgi:hypothetical protein